MKTKDVSSSAITIAGTVLGAMASRVVVDKIPVEKSVVKNGILAGVGLVCTSLLDRKDATSAFAQDVAIGLTATQLGELAKNVAGEQEGMFKTALGNPFETIDFLASPYEDEYDFIPTNPVKLIDVTPTTQEVEFR